MANEDPKDAPNPQRPPAMTSKAPTDAKLPAAPAAAPTPRRPSDAPPPFVPPPGWPYGITAAPQRRDPKRRTTPRRGPAPPGSTARSAAPGATAMSRRCPPTSGSAPGPVRGP